MRSHPPSLRTLVRRALLERCAVRPGDGLLLAVSGGPDSMALLHVSTQLPELELRVVAAGIDHGLRPEAAAELELAAQFAQRLGVEFVTRRLELSPGANLQARARRARYATLHELQHGRGLSSVATAHHADDRAETLVMRLLSGASPSGLAVLGPRDGERIRPMIEARKADVQLHLERHGVPFSHDGSNTDPRFLRTRVRQEVMPLLEELSPAVVRHLTALADELAESDASAPLPPVFDESGRPVPLSRAHREQLRRAIRYRKRSARVLLPGNRAVVLDQKSGQPRVESRPVRPNRSRK